MTVPVEINFTDDIHKELRRLCEARGRDPESVLTELILKAVAEQWPDKSMTAEQLVGFAKRPPGAPEFP